MHISELSPFQNQEVESAEVFRFDKSLQELKDLRLQLRYAADYCESTFSKAQDKKIVVENTKEYICRALITVVDHLGNVSANLDNCIPNTNAFSVAELRINSLKQRLLSCELYAHKLALNRVTWNAALPRYYRRYLSAPIEDVVGPNENSKYHGPSAPAWDCKFPSAERMTGKREFDIEDVPLFMYTYPNKSSAIKNLPSVLPVRDGVSILPKGPNPAFHFQSPGTDTLLTKMTSLLPTVKPFRQLLLVEMLGTQNRGRKNLLRRSFQSTEIMSLIRRIKRTA